LELTANPSLKMDGCGSHCKGIGEKKEIDRERERGSLTG
jgi:hypothetical protein